MHLAASHPRPGTAASLPPGPTAAGMPPFRGVARHRRHRGFTLFEIMMVLGILLIIVGIGLPAMITTVRKGPMRQAMSDIEEGFLKARMLAILTGQPAEFVISASSGSLAVRAVTETMSEEAGAEPAPGFSREPTGWAGELDADDRPRTEPLPKFSAKLDDSIAFRQLTISLRDMMDEEEAAVRFYPNGTSDAFFAVLFSEIGEERTVALEITTGRPRIETIR